MVSPYKVFSIFIGDPISVGVEREWQEALRLYTYNQDNELFLHSKYMVDGLLLREVCHAS